MAKNAPKIVFWVVSPFIFIGFLRLFFLVFYFIYGWLLMLILGREYHTPILVLAGATSLTFTIYVVMYLYRQYVKHIIGKG